MSLDLTSDKHGINGHSNGGGNSHKIGELVIKLDGLKVDMNAIPAASPPVMPLTGAVAASVSNPDGDSTSSRSGASGAAVNGTSTSNSSSSKQRRRTTGETPSGPERLPPLNKNNAGSSRTASSMTSLSSGKPFCKACDFRIGFLTVELYNQKLLRVSRH